MTTLFATPALSPWHAWRRGGITATDAASIMGYGGGTKLSVYLDKRGELPEVEVNEAMHWGNMIEPLLIEEFARREGVRILSLEEAATRAGGRAQVLFDGARYRLCFQDTHTPWIRSTPDAIYEKDGALGVLECKTTGFNLRHKWQADAPMAAQIQLQWNMHAGDLQFGALVCLIGGQRYVGYTAQAHKEAIAAIRHDAFAFQREHLIPGVEPAPVAEDLDLVREIARTEDGTTVDLPAESAAIDADLEVIDEQLRRLERDRDTHRAKIIRWIDQHSFGRVPGTNVTYTYHTQQRGDAEFRVLKRKAK